MYDTDEKMTKINQRLLRLNQQKAKLREAQRKRETRLKIELGGLVFTAGLNNQFSDLADKDGEARAIILGILATASKELHDPNFHASMLNQGRDVFALKSREKSRSQKSES